VRRKILKKIGELCPPTQKRHHLIHMYVTGLPDGLFSNQKSKFGLFLEGLVMEDVSIFYGHLFNFTDI
jgi:hypothetical protein